MSSPFGPPSSTGGVASLPASLDASPLAQLPQISQDPNATREGIDLRLLRGHPLPASLDAAQLGQLLQISPDPEAAREGINLRLLRGHPLPAGIRLPGSRKRFWLTTTVLEWLRDQEGCHNSSALDHIAQD